MTEHNPPVNDVSRGGLLVTGAVTVGTLGAITPVVAGNEGGISQTTDVFGQGSGGPVVAEDGATIRRSGNGVKVKLQMPTPESGSYEYPNAEENGTVSEPRHPEGFSLWVFVFDDPGDDDFTGVFLGAGHIVAGDTLTLSGHASTNTEPFVGERLRNPRRAEAHLAVAPHGEVDDEIMPNQIKTPGGGPEHWWFALFDSVTKP